MNLEKIKWCSEQKKGIQIVEEKQHLSDSYLKDADDTLESMLVNKGKWKLITGYYACYSAYYALLIRCGIRCEIHDCSIELMDLFGFDDNQIKFLINLKSDRIKVQYYLKQIELTNENDVKRFVSRCKEILNDLNSQKIENIRKRLKGELS